MRMILPTMHTFGADHGDGADAVIHPDTLTPYERALYDRGELLLNARLIGGQHQSTFVECPVGNWRLYQRPMTPGGYVVMDGECRFQGPLFLHGSVHHEWREEATPLGDRPQHMLNALKLNVPGTLRFMAECTLADLLPKGRAESTLSEREAELTRLARQLCSQGGGGGGDVPVVPS